MFVICTGVEYTDYQLEYMRITKYMVPKAYKEQLLSFMRREVKM